MHRNNDVFFLGYGFLVWLLATVSLRFVGLDSDRMLLNYALLVLGMPALNLAGYRWRGTQGADKYKASALFAVSGMVLDSLLVLNYPAFFSAANFPLMPPQGHYLGAWLLFGNALTLLTAYVSERLEKAPATPTPPQWNASSHAGPSSAR